MKIAFLLLFSFNAFAADHMDSMARLERMVASGVITAEAADKEKSKLTQPDGRAFSLRGAAQRGLASVTPSLKPLKIKRFKAKTMTLLLD